MLLLIILLMNTKMYLILYRCLLQIQAIMGIREDTEWIEVTVVELAV